ncbi:MAG: ATP-binding protein [Thiomicrorhabdus sp.]|jgi:DNA replication protein DnaC|nr:ATP-binding protein [Thiomicrorhabdus sp.]
MIKMENYSNKVEQSHCNKHGVDFVKMTHFMKGKETGVSGCEYCQQEDEKAAEVKKAAEARKTLDRFIPKYIAESIEAIGIPKRYQGATLESYIATTGDMKKAKRICMAYVERFTTCLHNGTSLVFCGNVGTGKTHLAISIAHEVVEQYQNIIKPIDFAKSTAARPSVFGNYQKKPPIAKLSNALDILRDVKSTYSRDSRESERDVIDFYVKHPLLVIDEVGVQYGSESDKIILFDILNRRYQDVKPTILISNLPMPELKEFIGERVVDRMREANGAVIDFSWESYRGEK